MGKKKAAVSPGKQQSPSFEQSLASIEQIVDRLESGELDLTQSLQQYELGVKQLRYCHQVLAQAEQKVSLLSGVDADGNPTTESLPDGQVRGGFKTGNPGESDVDDSGGLF